MTVALSPPHERSRSTLTGLADARAHTGAQPLRPAFVALCLALATVGLETLRVAPSVTVSDAFLVLTGLLVAACRPMARLRDEPLRVAWPVVGLLLLLVVGGLLSVLGGSEAVDGSLIVARTVIAVGGLTVLTGVCCRNVGRLEVALLAFGASAAVNGIVAAGQAAGVVWIPLHGSAWGRYSGLASHVNDAATPAALALPGLVALVCLWGVRNRRGWVALNCGALALCSIALSGSISAAGAAATGCLVAVGAMRWVLKPSRVLEVLAVVALVLTAVVVLVAALGSRAAVTEAVGDISFPWERTDVVMGSGALGEGTAGSRVEGFRYVWDRVRDDPFTGSGFPAAEIAGDAPLLPHNIVLFAWLGGGVGAAIGVVGLLGVGVVVALRTVGTSRVTRAARVSAVAAGALGAAVATAVVTTAQPFLYKRYLWVPLAVAVAVRMLGRRS